MKAKINLILFGLVLLAAWLEAGPALAQELVSRGERLPNIVFIYADDVGYGDVGSSGAKVVKTPNIDRLAAGGMRFRNAHATSATCTPSRYAVLTGEYPWRHKGVKLLAGDARALIQPGRYTLPTMLKGAGYVTGLVGKWHLGLGDGHLDWNSAIKPGPLEIGFDEAFFFPATADRVPTVYIDGHRVAGLDPTDPIAVDYGKKIGDEPTGKAHPELLKMRFSAAGHDGTIVDGVSRIGYMTGGKSARWVDEDMADVFTGKARAFIERHRAERFFLYFATSDIHVPRLPHARFVGTTGMGPRGDSIAQLDWTVGKIMDQLEQLDLSNDTLVIFSSDNGPVLDDGYVDGAVEKLGHHRPAGPYRGGKYSAFEGGTRVPFILRWPAKVRKGTSDALVGQIDLLSSLANLAGQRVPHEGGPDSLDLLPALLGRSEKGRDHFIENSYSLALIEGDWKVIAPSQGPKHVKGNETGVLPTAQLYNLKDDPGEIRNVSHLYPDRVRTMLARLSRIQAAGRSRI